MRRKLMILSVLGGSLIAGVGLADDECKTPMTRWQPRSAVEAAARERGWIVRRIRTDDGCYKLYGYDADGREIEAEFDPATMEMLAFELEGFDENEDEAAEGVLSSPPQAQARLRRGGQNDDDEHDDEDDDDDDGETGRGNGGNVAPAPPSNPLIGKPTGVIK